MAIGIHLRHAQEIVHMGHSSMWRFAISKLSLVELVG